MRFLNADPRQVPVAAPQVQAPRAVLGRPLAMSGQPLTSFRSQEPLSPSGQQGSRTMQTQAMQPQATPWPQSASSLAPAPAPGNWSHDGPAASQNSSSTDTRDLPASPSNGIFAWASGLFATGEEVQPATVTGGTTNGMTAGYTAAQAGKPLPPSLGQMPLDTPHAPQGRMPSQRGPMPLLMGGMTPEGKWPKEVLQHLGMAPQGVGSRPASSKRCREPATSGLRLVAGACQIPHPNKAEFGGEDSYFICSDGTALGVADGVGEWEKLGLSTRPMADQLMCCTSDAAEGIVGVGPDFAGERAALSLARGFTACTCFGACTAVVAALDSQGQMLGVANIGDSGIRQIRKNAESSMAMVANTTKDQQHFFNCPFQLTRRPREKDYPGLLAQGKTKLVEIMKTNIKMIEDKPEDADIYNFPLHEGDVLILGSDGLFDNLYDREILDFVDLAITPMEARQVYAQNAGTLRGPGSSTDPGALATTIAHAAYHRACDTSAASPFSACARSHGIQHTGGKLDDITVICAWAVRVAL